MLSKVTVEDVRKFGMIPEFLGRLPVMFTLDALTEDALVRILREPRNAILKQYEKLLAMDEVKLAFEDDALHAIAKIAKEKKVGARALGQLSRTLCLISCTRSRRMINIGYGNHHEGLRGEERQPDHHDAGTCPNRSA